MVEHDMNFNLHVRANEDILQKIKWLVNNYPVLYESNSHVIRCAIIDLYNKKQKELKEYGKVTGNLD